MLFCRYIVLSITAARRKKPASAYPALQLARSSGERMVNPFAWLLLAVCHEVVQVGTGGNTWVKWRIVYRMMARLSKIVERLLASQGKRWSSPQSWRLRR